MLLRSSVLSLFSTVILTACIDVVPAPDDDATRARTPDSPTNMPSPPNDDGAPVGPTDSDPDPNPNPNPNPDGEPPPIDGMGTAATRAQFEGAVRPILAAKCSSSPGCHGGTATNYIHFYPDAIEGFYDRVNQFPGRLLGNYDKTTAALLTKIPPLPSNHGGQNYSDADIAAIQAWLDAEKTARAGSEAPPTEDSVTAAVRCEWSGCMDLVAWNEEDVARAWAYENAEGDRCIACHYNGDSGFIASDDSARVFRVLTEEVDFMQTYFVVNVDVTPPKMEVNRLAFHAPANGLEKYIEHPRFNENGDAMAALLRYYDRIVARKAAGTCDQPRMAGCN